MNLKLTPKAQKIIAEKNGQITVSLEQKVCYSWGGAQSRDVPSVRWGKPESLDLSEYKEMDIDGITVYLHHDVKGIANARIDVVTGGVGTKLIFLGNVGIK